MANALVNKKTLKLAVVFCSNLTIERSVEAYDQLKALMVVDVYDRLSCTETNDVFESKIRHAQNYEKPDRIAVSGDNSR